MFVSNFFKEPFIWANQSINIRDNLWAFLKWENKMWLLTLNCICRWDEHSSWNGIYSLEAKACLCLLIWSLLTYHKGYISVIFSNFVKGRLFLMLRCLGTQIITILWPKKCRFVFKMYLCTWIGRKKCSFVQCIPEYYSIQSVSIWCNFKAVTFNHCQACCSLSLHVRFLQFCQNKYVV